MSLLFDMGVLHVLAVIVILALVGVAAGFHQKQPPGWPPL